jgi:signal transduction histidine kinase
MTDSRRQRAHARRSLLRRVALAFTSAVLLTTLILALAAYYLTKTDQENRALADAVQESRQNLTVADAMLPSQPEQSDYEKLMAAFAIRGDVDTLVQAGTETYVSGPNVTSAPITDELADSVAQGNVRYQTVDLDGKPTIVVGAQLRSGAMTVYFFFPQGERVAGLSRLRNVLIIGGVLLTVLGAIAGYLLARRLLGPIRAASAAAVQMSGGDLDIRLPAGPDEFGLLATSFNDMAESLQAKMLDLEAGQARERRFVADVTHELRTPVSALVGEASLLRAKLEADPADLPADVARLATMIERDITRLRQLVDDLLEISRLDARAVETVPEPVDIGPFLAQLVDAHSWTKVVRLGVPPRAVRAAGVPGPFDPVTVWTDRRRLERILVNLVENALHHGEVPVSIQATYGTGATEDEGIVEITVTDAGRGVPAEHLPYVFDRFYKADPSRSTGRGSGLGLAIAREYARLLGGDLTAANIPGGGALFLLVLPAGDL